MRTRGTQGTASKTSPTWIKTLALGAASGRVLPSFLCFVRFAYDENKRESVFTCNVPLLLLSRRNCSFAAGASGVVGAL